MMPRYATVNTIQTVHIDFQWTLTVEDGEHPYPSWLESHLYNISQSWYWENCLVAISTMCIYGLNEEIICPASTTSVSRYSEHKEGQPVRCLYLLTSSLIARYGGVVRNPSNDMPRKDFAYISEHECLYIRDIHAELRVTEGVKGEKRVRECCWGRCSCTIFWHFSSAWWESEAAVGMRKQAEITRLVSWYFGETLHDRGNCEREVGNRGNIEVGGKKECDRQNEYPNKKQQMKNRCCKRITDWQASTYTNHLVLQS